MIFLVSARYFPLFLSGGSCVLWASYVQASDSSDSILSPTAPFPSALPISLRHLSPWAGLSSHEDDASFSAQQKAPDFLASIFLSAGSSPIIFNRIVC